MGDKDANEPPEKRLPKDLNAGLDMDVQAVLSSAGSSSTLFGRLRCSRILELLNLQPAEAILPEAQVFKFDEAESKKKITDKSFQRGQLESLAKSSMTAEEFQLLKKDMDEFEARAKKKRLADEQIGKTYHEASRLFAASGTKEMPQKNFRMLGRQVIEQAAKPGRCNQGDNELCNVGAPEVKLYTTHPGAVAQVVADMAIKGKIVTASGRTIEIDEASRRPDYEALGNVPPGHKKDTIRGYASQLFQVAAANIKLDLDNQKNGTHWVYRLNVPEGKDMKTAVVDRRTGNAKLVTDDRGQPLKERTPDGKERTIEERVPKLNGLDVIAVLNQIVPQNGKPAYLMSFSHVGTLERLRLRLQGRPPELVTVDSDKELKEVLAKLKESDSFPIITQCHTGKGFLARQLAEFRKAGTVSGAGAGHVLNIMDYDPKTGQVLIDNQWGPFFDGDVAFDELVESMQLKKG